MPLPAIIGYYTAKDGKVRPITQKHYVRYIKPLTPKLKVRYWKPISPIPLRLDAVGKAGSAPNMSKTGARNRTKDREGHKIFPVPPPEVFKPDYAGATGDTEGHKIFPPPPPPPETDKKQPKDKPSVPGTPQVYVREIIVSKKTVGKTPIQRKFMTGFTKVESSSSTLEKILKKLKKPS